MKERGQPGRLVYFVECVGLGFVKIGVATSMDSRLEALQTGCPLELRVLLVIAGGPADERALHSRFAAYRSRGEWFRLEGELKTFVDGARVTSHVGPSALHLEIAAMQLRLESLRPEAERRGPEFVAKLQRIQEGLDAVRSEAA